MSSDPTQAADTHLPRQAAPIGVFALMGSRFWSHWRLKLRMVLVITPIFLAAYLGIQKLVGTPARTFNWTWFDEAAGFDIRWVYIYVSQYLIVPLPPLLAHSRDQLHRLTLGLSVTSALAFIVFLAYPVAAPRQPMPPESNFLYDWLMNVDGTGNAFPSLHVGLSTLAALYAHRVTDGFSRPARVTLLSIIWVWTLLIAWSTMATKQHYFHDVWGGFIVAFIGHHAAWRWRFR
jgi:membrane-associated phospholipid phosphatase